MSRRRKNARSQFHIKYVPAINYCLPSKKYTTTTTNERKKKRVKSGVASGRDIHLISVIVAVVVVVDVVVLV